MPENRARRTIAAANGIATDRTFGAVAPPLYLSSTFAFAGFEQPNDHDYLRRPFRFTGAVDDGRSSAFMSALEEPTRAAERPTWARSSPAPRWEQGAGGLDLGTLRQHKSILHVDAKISHGVLDLGMAE